MLLHTGFQEVYCYHTIPAYEVGVYLSWVGFKVHAVYTFIGSIPITEILILWYVFVCLYFI
jgi:hypothetical protein